MSTDDTFSLVMKTISTTPKQPDQQLWTATHFLQLLHLKGTYYFSKTLKHRPHATYKFLKSQTFRNESPPRTTWAYNYILHDVSMNVSPPWIISSTAILNASTLQSKPSIVYPFCWSFVTDLGTRYSNTPSPKWLIILYSCLTVTWR